jgi:hypothetical protein
MCARQVGGLFETRRVFVERSCNGGVTETSRVQDSEQLFKHALIEFQSHCFLDAGLFLDQRTPQRSTGNQSLRDRPESELTAEAAGRTSDRAMPNE